jgi:hypothetical protein
MQGELRDSLENLYPDSTIGTHSVQRLNLDVARGGTASAHILLKGLRVGGDVRFAAVGTGLPFDHAVWTRLVDVPVEENTGLIGFSEKSLGGAPSNAPNPFVVRAAPFRAYDAMAPARQAIAVDTDTVALRVDIPIPLDCRPRLYPGTVKLTHDQSCLELQLSIQVYKARIPPVGAASLPVTNWFSYENIATRHGLRPWSEPYWQMLRRYADLMAHGRQNTFWIPLPSIFVEKGPRVTLNPGRLERLVRLFTAAGLWNIEGGHLAVRTGGQWTAPTFDVAFGKQLANSPAGHAILVQLCRQLLVEIEKHGWRSRWLQHVTDEPISANAIDYRILVGMVHKYLPGIPILDATQDPKLVGSVDIWCPQVQEYQHDRVEYESQRALGDKVWYYTCCFPGGPWLNRLLDQELLRPALLGWGGALFNLDGFLHWGLNHYREDQDPFTQSVLPNHGGGVNTLPPGDTHIVYPGKDGPWSSLRLEAHREGFEDYELLQLLKARDPKKASVVLAKAIRGFDRYVKTVRKFRPARKALLEALT